VREFADGSNITIIRKVDNGRTQILPFNYRDVLKRKNLDSERPAEAGRHGRRTLIAFAKAAVLKRLLIGSIRLWPACSPAGGCSRRRLRRRQSTSIAGLFGPTEVEENLPQRLFFTFSTYGAADDNTALGGGRHRRRRPAGAAVLPGRAGSGSRCGGSERGR
jgi:hypothetical protein